MGWELVPRIQEGARLSFRFRIRIVYLRAHALISAGRHILMTAFFLTYLRMNFLVVKDDSVLRFEVFTVKKVSGCRIPKRYALSHSVKISTWTILVVIS